jgi:AbrB family looped-hinge helix DNA binding protein
MTSKVGPKGQVVIPKPLRDRLGIEPGDHVEVTLEADHVAVRTTTGSRPLRGRFAGRELSGELLRSRSRDRRREDRR